MKEIVDVNLPFHRLGAGRRLSARARATKCNYCQKRPLALSERREAAKELTTIYE
jgi:hypothetical protein